jgi:hypothetical protein
MRKTTAAAASEMANLKVVADITMGLLPFKIAAAPGTKSRG